MGANPYMLPTGPTSHPTPLWPDLLYGIYSTFGTTPTFGHVRGVVTIAGYSALFGAY
jgi:hypothetical protein